MFKTFFKKLLILTCVYSIFSCSNVNKENTWTAYKADSFSSSFSPLNQINVDNVHTLEQSWILEFDDLPNDFSPVANQSNPIVVDGIMYVNSGRQTVYAINAETGTKIWECKTLDDDQPSAASRGVVYWEKGDDKRILYSSGNYLIAIDAKNGNIIKNFGKEGRINLNEGIRDDPNKISVSLSTPGRIYKDLIIIGLRTPDSYNAPPGYIRAYNCITGELVWTFHTIPHPGEFGYDSWPEDAYKYAGGANCWAGLSMDESRGMVYLALGSPSYDYYGADRTGQNLFANCVLALDAATGKYKWHYQTVHHDLWDYDLPAPPNLIQVEKEGKSIDAVAQVTKHGFIFILDRETGQPIYPIEEKPVPVSTMPGEVSWPTQPFPTFPKPFVKQSMSINDIIDYKDEEYPKMVSKFKSLRNEGLFTPPDFKGTLSIPATRGGANWGGAAYNPNQNLLFIRANNLPEIITMVDLDKHFQARDNSIFEKGRVTYLKHCSSCHGENKKGNPPTFPDIDDLKNKSAENITLEKIRNGGGQMPAYKGVLSHEEQTAIMAFLYDKMGQNDMIATKEENTKVKYGNITGYRTWMDDKGRPVYKMPWGTLSALDLKTGEYLWQIPLGNDPKLQMTSDPTGLLGRSGPMATGGGLVFISGSEDSKVWAFDQKTGKMLWEKSLPAANNANISSYYIKGKQYIAMSVNGSKENPSGYIITFAIQK